MRFLGNEVGSLSPQHQRIAEYLMQNRQRIPLLTVEELAEEIGVSMATVSRFARAMGYSSLKELRIALHEGSAVSPSMKLQDRLDRIQPNDPISDILQFERENLHVTQDRLSQVAFDNAVGILDTTERVFVWADGPSLALVELLRFRLNRFGYTVLAIPPSGPAMAEGLLNIRDGDVTLVFCFLEDKPAARHVIDLATDRQASSILCTDLLVAEVVDRADVSLQIYRGALSEFHSLVAPIAVVDALVLGIARRRPDVRTAQLRELERIRLKLSF